MRNELTTERQNALPSTDYVVMIVPPKHTVLSSLLHALYNPRTAGKMLVATQDAIGETSKWR